MRKSIFRPWNGLPQSPVFWSEGRAPNDTSLGRLQHLYEKKTARYRLRENAKPKRYVISASY